MSRENREADDTPTTERLRKGSDELTEGLAKTTSGISRIILSLWDRLEGHPVLKTIIVASGSAVIGKTVWSVLGAAHTFFFGETAVISRDVSVQTFPAPLGFSVLVISVALVAVIIAGYLRFVSLRQRIEQLEAKAGQQ